MTSLIDAIDAPASLLGESPVWHAREQALYWCDIAGRSLNRFQPTLKRHDVWRFDAEVSSCAPMQGGGMLLAMRDGLWRVDAGGQRSVLAPAPYDTAQERFNDGKCDPCGRFWVGTLYEPRTSPLAALYRYANGVLTRMAGGITNSNGLAWSPDARTLYWTDTAAHTIYALDFDAAQGSLGARRIFAAFAPKLAGRNLSAYGGRPDGAAVDVEGAYWVAMYEGQRLLRMSAQGQVLREVALPVRCPTMPCFGGADLKTLYVTTAREGRPDAELQAQPLAGRVLTLRVDVPGLPAHEVRE